VAQGFKASPSTRAGPLAKKTPSPAELHVPNTKISVTPFAYYAKAMAILKVQP
jgi:hypothetical protein